MKIFVTGLKGFIAQNLVIRFEKDGHIVNGTFRGEESLFDKLTLFRPDVICHLATEALDPDNMLQTNIIQTYLVLEYCRYNKVQKLLIFGSSSEYGCKDHPLTEKDLLEPKTIYEGTKAAATLLSRAYAYTYSIPTVVIRPMSVYGPHEKNSKLMTMLFSNRLKYLNNANHDWMYIDEFVEATVRIMNYKDTELFDIVNVGLGVQRSNQEVVSIAESLMGLSINYTPSENQLGNGSDSQLWVCDPTYLRTKYGFTPSISLEEGMKKHYEWFKNCLINSQTVSTSSTVIP
jgi:nucleoside-diphosphate-sugar epimerase